MLVVLVVEGEERLIQAVGPTTVGELVEGEGIHPSTVLASSDGVVVPLTTVVKGDSRIELIVVSSGG